MSLFMLQRILTLLSKGLDGMERELNSLAPEELALREGDLDPEGPLRHKDEDR